jgi:hypothetical protein
MSKKFIAYVKVISIEVRKVTRNIGMAFRQQGFEPGTSPIPARNLNTESVFQRQKQSSNRAAD